MAKRPIKDKQVQRLRRALTNTPPVNLDLIDFLVKRGHAQTKREARQMLLDGKVLVGSHKVGRLEIEAIPGKKTWVLSPYVPAKYKNEIVVVP